MFVFVRRWRLTGSAHQVIGPLHARFISFGVSGAGRIDQRGVVLAARRQAVDLQGRLGSGLVHPGLKSCHTQPAPSKNSNARRHGNTPTGLVHRMTGRTNRCQENASTITNAHRDPVRGGQVEPCQPPVIVCPTGPRGTGDISRAPPRRNALGSTRLTDTPTPPHWSSRSR